MKKRIWKNYFDVVILPPRDVSDYARKLSKELSRHGTKWTLGKNSFIPHISLYHIAVKPKDFESFIAEIRNTIKNFAPGHLQTTVVEPNMLLFDKPPWIRKLYLTVIKNTHRFLDRSYRVQSYWPLQTFPKRMHKIGARFLKAYGTPMVGANFRPHVSLTSFKNSAPDLPLRKARRFTFKPTHLIVCELGPSHSCQRVVKKLAFLRS